MKHLACIIVVMCAIIACGEGDESNDLAITPNAHVRHVRWGMTMKEVKDVENWELLWEEPRREGMFDVLKYHGKMLEWEMILSYAFRENELRMVVYSIPDESMTAYAQFRKILTNKYGDPETNPQIVPFYCLWQSMMRKHQCLLPE